MAVNFSEARTLSYSRSVENTNPLLLKKKPIYETAKRVFDIVASLAGLAVLSIPMTAISLAIFIDDPGNPFFVQERIGKDGKTFKIYKFRTMVKNAEQLRHSEDMLKENEANGPLFKVENDKRILRSGKILRKMSLDELPQLINILKGDMSVIGPRPFIPEEQDKLISERLLVKPGLSCYWQIMHTKDMPIEDQMMLDLQYLQDRSMSTDIKLIFKTMGVVLKKENC